MLLLDPSDGLDGVAKSILIHTLLQQQIDKLYADSIAGRVLEIIAALAEWLGTVLIRRLERGRRFNSYRQHQFSIPRYSNGKRPHC